MEDISQKINDILGDEESMKQIRELADMLMGRYPLPEESSDASSQSSPADADSGTSAESFDRDFSEAPKNEAPSGGMPDLSALMGMLSGMGGQQGGGTESTDGGIDIGALMQISQALANASEDNNRRLLAALRPFLHEDKQARLDKAMKLLKLYAVYTQLKSNGMLNDLGKLI